MGAEVDQEDIPDETAVGVSPGAGGAETEEDRGAHELKGVPGEWRLFAVASV